MDTTAERDGDERIGDGTTTRITNADYADFGHIVVMITSAEPKSDRISVSSTDTDTDGFAAERSTPTLSTNGLQVTVRLDGLRVMASHCLGEPGDVPVPAMESITPGRVHVAARCVGLLPACSRRPSSPLRPGLPAGTSSASASTFGGMVAVIATWQQTTAACGRDRGRGSNPDTFDVSWQFRLSLPAHGSVPVACQILSLRCASM